MAESYFKSCLACGKDFKVFPCNEARRKYCSYSCSSRALWAAKIVPLAERFWSKVDIKGESECWNWIGSTAKGYGYIKVAKGKNARSNRVAYELTFGDIPDGAVVRHKCDNPSCCNPAHLQAGTQKDNVTDMILRGRNAKAIVANDSAAEVHAAYLSGASAGKLAEQYGVGISAIYRILRKGRIGYVQGISSELRSDRASLNKSAAVSGGRHPMAKLDECRVLQIRREYADGGISLRLLAKKHMVATGTIQKIVERRTWKHL